MMHKRFLLLISLLLVFSAEAQAEIFYQESDRINAADKSTQDAAFPLNFKNSQEKPEESKKHSDKLFETLEKLNGSIKEQANTNAKEQYPSFLSDNQNTQDNQTQKTPDSQVKKNTLFPKKFPNMGLGPQLRMKTDIRNRTEIRNTNL